MIRASLGRNKTTWQFNPGNGLMPVNEYKIEDREMGETESDDGSDTASSPQYQPFFWLVLHLGCISCQGPATAMTS